MNEPDLSWDAGNMGCGELVLELKFKLKELNPGQSIKLIAKDPGAPQDLPAWCKLTGNRLLKHQHPEYWIEKT